MDQDQAQDKRLIGKLQSGLAKRDGDIRFLNRQLKEIKRECKKIINRINKILN